MLTEIDSERRYALIIANSKYQDEDLEELIAPGKDSEYLANVLSDPKIGNFNVQTMLNEPAHRIIQEIDKFFKYRNRNDVLLLYFSCHGIKDVDGFLYFAALDTNRKYLASTAVSANYVNERMRESRSRRQLLILDCCNSGAFAKGAIAKADKMIHAGGYFGGKGRVVITASDSMQYSFEEDNVTGDGKTSVFTSSLVEGLQTGKADIDRNGLVSYNELYEYVYKNITNETTYQTPEIWAFGIQGGLDIAKNPHLYEPLVHEKNKIVLNEDHDIKDKVSPELLASKSVSNKSSSSKPGSPDVGTFVNKNEKISITKPPLIFIVLAAIGAVVIVAVLYVFFTPTAMSESIKVNEDSQNRVIDLNSLFQNSNNQQGLIYSVSGNSNPSLVQPSINSTNLILSFVPDQSGFADVSVNASGSVAKSKIISIKVTVIPVNDEPKIRITYPKNNSALTKGGGMLFTAQADDPEDGDISKSIKWTSSIDGKLGEGPRIFPDLSVGNHSITATTKDKAGVAAHSDILIRIIAK